MVFSSTDNRQHSLLSVSYLMSNGESVPFGYVD